MAPGLATGYAGIAVNVGGRDNAFAVFGKFMNTAFNVLGTRNTVLAGAGPFALAGWIAQRDQNLSRQKPGFNINGIQVPKTAAAAEVEAPE